MPSNPSTVVHRRVHVTPNSSSIISGPGGTLLHEVWDGTRSSIGDDMYPASPPTRLRLTAVKIIFRQNLTCTQRVANFRQHTAREVLLLSCTPHRVPRTRYTLARSPLVGCTAFASACCCCMPCPSWCVLVAREELWSEWRVVPARGIEEV